jgi:long-chain acyl-CoA synthetase
MNPAATAHQLTDRERQNLAKVYDYSTVQTIPEIWAIVAQRHGPVLALHAPHLKPPVQITYGEMVAQIQQFAQGLQSLGVQPEDRISLFADNSPRWFIADQGMMLAGAVNAVRSSQADKEELLFILQNSGSSVLVVEDHATFQRLRDRLDPASLRAVIFLSDEPPSADGDRKILNFSQLIDRGCGHPLQPVQRTRDDLATLIYTSGTTGQPKGVMLTHGNLMHQVTTFGTIIQPAGGDRVLSILPTWHSYERTVEYYLLSQGCTQVYTSIRTIKKDLKTYKPHYMVSVPRIWESVYEGVQKQFKDQPAKKQKLIQFFLSASQRYIGGQRLWQNLDLLRQDPALPQRLLAGLQALLFYPFHALGEKIVYEKIRTAVTGGEFRAAISGGGALPRHMDDFFEIVGVNVLVGYGLTETSPVTNVRRPWRNLKGSSGPAIAGTSVRVVDPETRQDLPQGKRGLVLLKGPQIMKGYYNNPTATAKAIDANGWFDSGDLGWITSYGDLVLTGRAKDTIVLTNGENIEPEPIEGACLRSPYIQQIMLVGQDQKSLGAFIVPNSEALQTWAIGQGFHLAIPNDGAGAEDAGLPPAANLPAIALDDKPIQDLFRQELNREVQNRPGYKVDDRIGPYRLILEPFSIDNGLLTQTLKMRRNVVMDRYQGMINEMFV